MISKRRPKGSVGVERLRGRLRLRLPRSLYGGRQKYVSLGLADSPDNRKFAEMQARQIELDLLAGVFDPTWEKYKPQLITPSILTPSILTIPGLPFLWEKFTSFKKPTVAASTLATDYEKTRRMITDLPTKAIADAVQIRDILLANHPPNAVKRYLVQLSACCDWAVKSGYIEHNLFKGMAREIVLPKSSREEIEAFTAEERDLIISSFRESKWYSHYANFVEFLFFSGCRPSEAIALQWDNISPCLKFIIFRQAATESLSGTSVKPGLKTQSKRKFPVNNQLKEILLKAREKYQGDYVFLSPKGTLIDFHNFRNRAWVSVVKDIDIPYKKPYATRHTFISLCLEAGIDAKEIARWVGNSPEMIYKHYASSNVNILVPEL